MTGGGDRHLADRWLSIDPLSFEPRELEPAIRWLEQGRLVAFPTDTVYGLAANPASAEAVAALFDVKGRDERLAIPVIAASAERVREAAPAWNARQARAAAAFWPGPLSLLVDVPAWMTPRVHAGQATIAVRVPDHAVARALAAGCSGFVTATSANRSGAPTARSASTLDEIRDDPRVLVIDAGESPGGLPSTIVDLRGDEPVLIRPGAIAWEQLLHHLSP